MYVEPKQHKSEDFHNKGAVNVESSNPGLHIFENLKVSNLHIEDDLFINSYNVTLDPSVCSSIARQLQSYINASSLQNISSTISDHIDLHVQSSNTLIPVINKRVEEILLQDDVLNASVRLNIDNCIETLPTTALDGLIDRLFERILDRDISMLQKLEAKVREHKLKRFEQAALETEEECHSETHQAQA